MNRTSPVVQKRWMAVGEIEAAVRKYGRPMIRNYRDRTAFTQRHVLKHGILPFYNCGFHIYCDQQSVVANTFYSNPWKLVRYEDFSSPNSIGTNFSPLRNGVEDTLLFQHWGHDGAGNAHVVIGSKWSAELGRPMPYQQCVIPPRCILYVASLFNHVKELMLQPQPLPWRVVPWYATPLKPTPSFQIVK